MGWQLITYKNVRFQNGQPSSDPYFYQRYTSEYTCTKSKIHLNKHTYILETRVTRFTKSGELCVDFVFVTQISKCMKMKQLKADNRFLTFYIGYCNFRNKRLINRLSGESTQH